VLWNLQLAEDLAVVGEATLGVLGEDELAVPEDVELPLAAREIPGVESVGVQLGRETRGPLVIARSGGAVVDLDRHGESLPTADDGSRVAAWPG
jgi:hypothetical protein